MGIFMKICVRCRRTLNDYDHICPSCGTFQPPVPQQFNNQSPAYAPVPNAPVYAPAPVYRPRAPRRLKGAIPLLVWSLLLVLFFNIVGTPLGVVGAILCVTADADRDEKSGGKLKTATVLCIVATVIDVLTLVYLAASSYFVLRG